MGSASNERFPTARAWPTFDVLVDVIDVLLA
jgi:hypothetical protein